MTVTAFAIHEIADYDAWRIVYDASEPLRPAGHVLSHSVHRLEGSPNTIMVVLQFPSAHDAHAFWESPDLLAAMRESGVTAIPRIEYFLDT